MIRKISTRDVVPKSSDSSEPTRRERDYLIERLTRKHVSAPVAETPVKVSKNRPRRERRFSFGKKWIWLSTPIVIILIVLIVLQFMVSAVITVKPKQLTVPIDAKLIASINATTSPTALTYQVITLNAEDSEIVLATNSVATKPQKAAGQIIIFNSNGTASQTLITNTRFESADGLIYRIQKSVDVPGTTIVNGNTVPGSVTVSVVADQTGSNYNIDMTDFTIPGFKSDTRRFTKIFARSKTAMTGGSDGSSMGVSDEARQTAKAGIENRLRDSLLKQVQAQKTANSVVFDSASKFSFKNLPDTAGSDAQHVVVHEQGTISSITFDKQALGKLLLSNAIESVGNSAEIHGIDTLHFIAAVASTSPIWQVKPFNFTLSGSVDVVGVVDTTKLMKDIVGISRSDLVKVLSNYSTIDKVTASIKPPWKGSFPNDASKIKIEIVK